MNISKREMIALTTSFFCAPVGLVYSIVALRKETCNWRVFILCIAWAMSIFAYCYEPTTESDLVRYNAYMEQLEGHTFNEALSIGQYGEDGLISFVFICWLVASLGDIRLLPMISVFCVYYIGLYVTCKVGEELDVKNKVIHKYILLILMMISFYSVVNNIRNIWAFSLLGFAIFRECFMKKRDIFTLFLYIFPIFLHTSAIIFVLLRVVLRLTGKIRVICTLLVFIVPIALNFMSNLLSSFSSGNIIIQLLINMIVKGNNYFEHTTTAWAVTVQNSGSERYARIIYVSFAFVMTCLYFKIKQNRNIKLLKITDNKKFSNVLDFGFLTALLTLSCMSMVMPEYWRFVMILILFGGGIYYFSIMNFKKGKIIENTVLIFGPLCMVYWIRNLFIYSDLGIMMIRAFMANPIFVGILKAFGSNIEIFS